jgi:group I intron endonuclease
MSYYIYLYTNPKNKKSYVGITDNIERRKSGHIQKEWNEEDCKFARAIKKHGYNSFEFSVLEEVENMEQAKVREVYWVQFYDSYTNGYNSTLGGDYNGTPRKLSDRDVEDIRFLLQNKHDLKLQDIADMYKVNITCISQIKNNKLRCGMNKIGKIERPGSFKKGEDNTMSKLTVEQVKDIKNSLSQGIRRSELMKKYGVTKNAIREIAVGKSWKHVESDYKYERRERCADTKMTKEKVIQLRQDVANGMTHKAAGEKYQISRMTVQQIVYRKSWKDI